MVGCENGRFDPMAPVTGAGLAALVMSLVENLMDEMLSM